jgi:hypothetical protein
MAAMLAVCDPIRRMKLLDRTVIILLAASFVVVSGTARAMSLVEFYAAGARVHQFNAPAGYGLRAGDSVQLELLACFDASAPSTAHGSDVHGTWRGYAGINGNARVGDLTVTVTDPYLRVYHQRYHFTGTTSNGLQVSVQGDTDYPWANATLDMPRGPLDLFGRFDGNAVHPVWAHPYEIYWQLLFIGPNWWVSSEVFQHGPSLRPVMQPVPDGATTACLLGFGVIGLAVANRTRSARR